MTPPLRRFAFRVMACPCEIRMFAADAGAAQRTAQQLIAEAGRIEARYSRYRADSATSHINVNAGRSTVTVDAETAALLDYAAVCYAESGGCFDITSGVLRRAWDFRSGRLPPPDRIAALLELIGWDQVVWDAPSLFLPKSGMELDFGGIGKEYAVDRLATMMLDQGIEHGLVDLGGDLRIVGPQADGSPWQVGLRHPRRSGAVLMRVPVYRGAVASSGDYERFMIVAEQRYSHLLDPRTGWPVRDTFQAISVFAEHCTVAGSAASIAMLLGAEGGAQWLDDLGTPHVRVGPEGNVCHTLDRLPG